MQLTNSQYRQWLQTTIEILKANGGDTSAHELALNGDGKTTGGVFGDDPGKTYEVPNERFSLPA